MIVSHLFVRRGKLKKQRRPIGGFKPSAEEQRQEISNKKKKEDEGKKVMPRARDEGGMVLEKTHSGSWG